MNVVEVKRVRIGEGATKICVPMVAPTDYDVDAQIRTIKRSKTDLVEFRADCFEDCLDMDILTKTLEKIQDKLSEFPIIFTFRTRSEGGSHDITPDQYREMLLHVIKSGYADLIDVEYFYDIPFVTEVIETAHAHGVKVIVSNHDFKTTLPMEQIVNRFKDMINTGTDIAKIAMMPEDGSQVVDMMQAAKELQESGELGVSTRTTGEMYGNCISFATAGIPSAPGQIDVEALRSQLEMIHNIIGS